VRANAVPLVSALRTALDAKRPPVDKARRRLLDGLRPVAMFIAIAASLVVCFTSDEPRIVGAILLATWLPLLLVLSVSSYRDGRRQFVEIGVVYAAVVSIYTVVPLLGYVAAGYSYTPFSDSRLFASQPSPDEVAFVAWHYVAYLFVFVAVYRAVRGGANFVGAQGMRVEKSLVWAVVILLALGKGLHLLILAAYGSAADDSYLGSYLRLAAAPVLVQQFHGHLTGMVFVLQICAVVLLCRDFARGKWLLVAWIALEAAFLLTSFGARTSFAVLLLTSVIAYCWFVRPLPLASLVSLAIIGLAGFVLIGIVRSSGGLLSVAEGAFAASGEFEAIFGNAIDARSLSAAGETSGLWMPTYLGDILSIVPQQLLPFEKSNLADWYLRTYHFEFGDSGGGFAFGAIAESLVGAGSVDVVWRAALVGGLFALVHRYAAARMRRFWPIVFCLWLSVFSYACFRVSTLEPMARFVYQFGGAYVGVCVAMIVLKRAMPSDVRRG
jgi:hypothetical protein